MISQLVVEPLPDPLAGSRTVAPPIAPSQRSRSTRRRRIRWLPAHRNDDLELREVHLAQAQVAARVQRTPVGDRAGAGEQVAGVPLAQPGGAADLLGHLVHLLAGLEEPSALPRST